MGTTTTATSGEGTAGDQRAETAAPDYKGFASWCLNQGPFVGCDLDGGAVQETALHFGIIKQVEYDPRVHGENEWDVAPGDPWYVTVDDIDGNGEI